MSESAKNVLSLITEPNIGHSDINAIGQTYLDLKQHRRMEKVDKKRLLRPIYGLFGADYRKAERASLSASPAPIPIPVNYPKMTAKKTFSEDAVDALLSSVKFDITPLDPRNDSPIAD